MLPYSIAYIYLNALERSLGDALGDPKTMFNVSRSTEPSRVLGCEAEAAIKRQQTARREQISNRFQRLSAIKGAITIISAGFVRESPEWLNKIVTQEYDR